MSCAKCNGHCAEKTGQEKSGWSLKIWLCLSFVVVAFSLAACETVFGPANDESSLLDGPIEGLSWEEKQLHAQCDIEFGHVFTPEEGVGPIFNAQSCEGCHAADGRSHSAMTLRRFGHLEGDVVDPLIELGGPQLQDKAIRGFKPEFLPSNANVHADFLAPAVTGLGYLEAIDDSTIIAAADPDDKDGDGISGVAAFVDKPDYIQLRAGAVQQNGKVVARFGRKATAVNLLHQSVNALLNDMGLSSEYHPLDIAMPQSGGLSGDLVPEPEVPSSRVHAMVYYLQTLKSPPRRQANDAAVLRGEKVFQTIGCASCHSPTLRTGKSDIKVLSQQTIHPYTDLLLHDMGAELNDGYTEGAARSAEWRTTPLWGLGLASVSTGGQILLLHDGRAHSVTEAILLHGGEGNGSRNKFKALSTGDQQDLLLFLESL